MKKIFASIFILFLMLQLTAQVQPNPYRALFWAKAHEEEKRELMVFNWQTMGDFINIEELYATLMPELKGKKKKIVTSFFNDWINKDGSSVIDYNALCVVASGEIYLPITDSESFRKMLKKMGFKEKWHYACDEDGRPYHYYPVYGGYVVELSWADLGDVVVISPIPFLSSGGRSVENFYMNFMPYSDSYDWVYFYAFEDDEYAESFLKHLSGIDIRIEPNYFHSFNPSESPANYAYYFHLSSGKGFVEMNGYQQPVTPVEYPIGRVEMNAYQQPDTSAIFSEQPFYNEETHNPMLVHYLSPEAQCVFSSNMISNYRLFPFSDKHCKPLSLIPIELFSNSFVGSVNKNKTFTIVAPLKINIEDVLAKNIEMRNDKLDVETAISHYGPRSEIDFYFLERDIKQKRKEILKHHARFQEENSNSNLIDTLYEEYMLGKYNIESDDDKTSFKITQYDWNSDDNYFQRPILYFTVKDDVVIFSNEDISDLERTDNISVVQKRVLDNSHLPFFFTLGEMGELRVDEKRNIYARYEMDTEGKKLLQDLLIRLFLKY